MKEVSCYSIKGIKIGNAENIKGASGCTVILFEDGVIAGVDVRGSAPATRETDVLDPKNSVEKINAVVLSGGSAYGLEASCGVMKYLEEKGKGFEVGVGVVPIVCSACIFDLPVGDAKCRPDIKMGYEACLMAEKNNYKDGCYGAGAGATVGKVLGPKGMMKSGMGSYFVQCGELIIGAIVVVNAFGDVYDEKGNFLAGLLTDGKRTISVQEALISHLESEANFFRENTTIGCVITNAKLTKAQCSKIAAMAHDGLARTIKPVHTSMDGDTIFTMATGEVVSNNIALESLASDVMQEAVIRAVKGASPMYGLECFGSR